MSDIEIESWDDELSIEEDIEIEEEDSAHESDEESEDEYDIQLEDEDIESSSHNTFIRLTKYEKTKILGLRAKQIELGAQPKIKYSKTETPLEIAEREFKMKKMPFRIKRKLPTGEVESIKLRNLI